MRRLLLIEDEEVILKALTRLLERHRHDVVAVRDVDAAEALDPRGFDLVLADLRLPGRDGTAVIPIADPVPVVVMTSHASVRSAVEAMRAGASDYIAKPFDHDELLLVLERAFNRNRLLARNHALERELARAEPSARRVAGTALDALVEELLDAPDDDGTLHLHGEIGSGREDVAREHHARGPHAAFPLTVVDATTDGDALANGIARGGTLVLRHPERLPLPAQEALAARLPDAATSRPGERPRTVPFRLVTLARERVATLAAHRGLGTALAGPLGAREREVPALATRRGDVATLARRAARRIGERHAGRPATLSATALAALAAGPLEGGTAVLERRVELAVLGALGSLDALDRASDGAASDGLVLPDDAFGAGADVPITLDLDGYFRYAVLRLQRHLSETELAAHLGISRKSLWERRHRMGLPRPSSESANP